MNGPPVKWLTCPATNANSSDLESSMIIEEEMVSIINFLQFIKTSTLLSSVCMALEMTMNRDVCGSAAIIIKRTFGKRKRTNERTNERTTEGGGKRKAAAFHGKRLRKGEPVGNNFRPLKREKFGDGSEPENEQDSITSFS